MPSHPLIPLRTDEYELNLDVLRSSGRLAPSMRFASVVLAEPPKAEAYTLLPMRLQQLILKTRRLHARILHLDTLIAEDRPTPRPVDSPVAAQHGRLLSAFGGRQG